jgi:hypothetical protein
MLMATSIGLNYFTAVVPKVEEFNKKFAENLKSLQMTATFYSSMKTII